MSVHKISNHILTVTVDDAGAELSSVIDHKNNAERIWTADPAVWNRHAPILFPFVGKVIDGRYRIGDKTWQMKTQHGFARDQVFSPVNTGEHSVTHCLESNQASREIYPYDFRLMVTHTLDPENERRLVISWRIENTGTAEMFFSIGGHPGFLMPEGVQKEDCLIQFPGKDQLSCFPASPAGFALPQKKHALPMKDGFARYQPDIPDTWIFENQQISAVRITGPDKTPYVTMHCEGFPLLAVWANPKGNFICLEPWYGRTDDEGFTGTIDEKPGIQKLSSGQAMEISYSIIFHEL